MSTADSSISCARGADVEAPEAWENGSPTRRFKELKMMPLPRPLAGRAFAAGFALCVAAALGAAPNPTPSASPGLDLSGIDRTVPPGADFFAHANGAWLKATEIPADRAAYGVAGLVTERTNQRTAELIQR